MIKNYESERICLASAAEAANQDALMAIDAACQFMTGISLTEFPDYTDEILPVGMPLWAKKRELQNSLYRAIKDDELSLVKLLEDDTSVDAFTEEIAQRLPEADPEITSRICKLGAAITEFAYKAFGDEIDVLVDAFLLKTATMSGESYATELEELLGFLLNRINDAADVDYFDDLPVGAADFYRTSPRVIIDTEYKARPNCYALAAMYASLLKKLGITDVVHCGAVEQRGMRASLVLSQIAGDAVETFAGKNLVEASEIEKLRNISIGFRDHVREFGTHAYLIFRHEGNVTILDKYYGTFIRVVPGSINYRNLKEGMDAVRENLGVEPIVLGDVSEKEAYMSSCTEGLFGKIRHFYPSDDELRGAFIEGVEQVSTQPMLAPFDLIISKNLKRLSPATLVNALPGTCLFDTNVAEFFYNHPESTDEEAEEYLAILISEYINTSIGRVCFGPDCKTIQDLEMQLIACQADTMLLELTISRFTIWLYQVFIERLGEHVVERRALPIFIEMGQLDHRIGASVLLNVTYALDMKLPLEWWLRQTSSQLPGLFAREVGAKMLHEVEELLDREPALYTRSMV